MIAYPEKIRYNVMIRYAEVRRLWKFTEMLKKQRTQLKNQLHILLYTSLRFSNLFKRTEFQTGCLNYCFNILQLKQLRRQI